VLTKTFDKKFDENEDVSDALDISKSRRPNQEQRRVNVDFPTWMIESLDKEAKHRQSIWVLRANQLLKSGLLSVWRRLAAALQ